MHSGRSLLTTSMLIAVLGLTACGGSSNDAAESSTSDSGAKSSSASSSDSNPNKLGQHITIGAPLVDGLASSTCLDAWNAGVSQGAGPDGYVSQFLATRNTLSSNTTVLHGLGGGACTLTNISVSDSVAVPGGFDHDVKQWLIPKGGTPKRTTAELLEPRDEAEGEAIQEKIDRLTESGLTVGQDEDATEGTLIPAE